MLMCVHVSAHFMLLLRMHLITKVMISGCLTDPMCICRRRWSR